MPYTVIPAQAGIQTLVFQEYLKIQQFQPLDPRLRGNDGVGRPYLITVKWFFLLYGFPVFSDGLPYQHTHSKEHP